VVPEGPFKLRAEFSTEFLSFPPQLFGLLTEFAQLPDSFVVEHAQ
jgi:hypothetical protein